MNRLALAFVGLTLAAAPALAQNSNMAPNNNPNVRNNNAATMPANRAAAPGTVNYMTQMKPGEWRASKLTGVNVYNNANEKIGDINEILIDNKGQVEAVVIGVGGFLGLGEHDVAVPFDQLKPVMNAVNASSSTSTSAPNTNTAANTNTANGAFNNTANNAARNSNDVTGTVMTNSDRGYPDHFVLDATKDQLKAAPQFKYTKTR